MTPTTSAVRAACGRLRNGVPSCEYPACGCPLSVSVSPGFFDTLLANARAEEREECARVADAVDGTREANENDDRGYGYSSACRNIAHSIRARAAKEASGG